MTGDSARPRGRAGPLEGGHTRCSFGAFAAALGREVTWVDQSKATLLTRSEDNEYQYLVTTGHFGAHFPNERLVPGARYRRPQPARASPKDLDCAQLRARVARI